MHRKLFVKDFQSCKSKPTVKDPRKAQVHNETIPPVGWCVVAFYAALIRDVFTTVYLTKVAVQHYGPHVRIGIYLPAIYLSQ